MDVERPLNQRGLRDAPLMGELIFKYYPNIDKFYSSHAVRAHETAKHIIQGFNRSTKEIIIEHDLYHASSTDFSYLINSQSDSLSCIAMFSHNPGITYFANDFSDYYIDNVPTCGVVVLASSADKWSDVNTENTMIVNYYYPKKDLLI